MSLLLRIVAVYSLIWAGLLLYLKDQLVAAEQLSPLVRALANSLGAAYIAMGCMFWYGARAPVLHRGAIYGAIVLLVLKTANDLYGFLLILPPELALLSLIDLVFSITLLVSVLESLPRTFGTTQS